MLSHGRSCDRGTQAGRPSRGIRVARVLANVFPREVSVDAPNPVLLARLQTPVLVSTFINYTFNFIFSFVGPDADGSGAGARAKRRWSWPGLRRIFDRFPWVGRAIDRNHFGLPLGFAFFGNLLGVIALVSSTDAYVIFLAASSILFSAGCISTMSNYVREGLTPAIGAARSRPKATWSPTRVSPWAACWPFSFCATIARCC